MSLPKGEVIYQGYPVSMPDGNGDGIGDFNGIERTTLPYLGKLGVSGVWLSPFYASPWKDGGYDVSDHLAVNPMHGTLEDAESMIRQAGRLGIDVIADLVPCASSDKHPEFQRALRDRTNTSYIFADSPDGHPPNNWRSVFPREERDPETGAITRKPESAWRRVRDYWPHDAAPERLDQFVLTNFAAYQPNWNHSNPAVRKHLQDVARFWLERGVRGFRVDSVDYLDHDRQLPDEPKNPYYRPDCLPCDELDRRYSMRGPNNFPYLKELVSVIEKYPEAYMMLESYPNRFDPGSDPAEHYARYYRELDGPLLGKVAPFCFEVIDQPWDAQRFKQAIDTFQHSLRPDDVPVYPGGNHDKHRLASRYGERAARAAAVMQLALPGVIIIYQGDELGMTNHTGIPDSRRTDPYVDRDVSRSPVPMHADDPRAGFSETHPDNFRLPIHPEYERFNVRTQQQDPNSTWNLYRRSIQARRQSLTLREGDYKPVSGGGEHTFAFVRTGEDGNYLSVTNFADAPMQVNLGHLASSGQLVVTSKGEAPSISLPLDALSLGPEESVLIRLG